MKLLFFLLLTQIVSVYAPETYKPFSLENRSENIQRLMTEAETRTAQIEQQRRAAEERRRREQLQRETQEILERGLQSHRAFLREQQEWEERRREQERQTARLDAEIASLQETSASINAIIENGIRQDEEARLRNIRTRRENLISNIPIIQSNKQYIQECRFKLLSKKTQGYVINVQAMQFLESRLPNNGFALVEYLFSLHQISEKRPDFYSSIDLMSPLSPQNSLFKGPAKIVTAPLSFHFKNFHIRLQRKNILIWNKDPSVKQINDFIKRNKALTPCDEDETEEPPLKLKIINGLKYTLFYHLLYMCFYVLK